MKQSTSLVFSTNLAGFQRRIMLRSCFFLNCCGCVLLPPPRRICNRRCLFVCLFVSLSVCLLATLRKKLRTDLHEIFKEGWQRANEQMIKFWWQSGSRIRIGIRIRIGRRVRRALAEVCTVPVLLDVVALCVHIPIIHVCIVDLLLDRIARTTYVDAVYCYRPSNVVCLSVCLSVCRYVTLVSRARTAEPIEMPFELRTRVGPGSHVLDFGPDPPWEKAFLRGKGLPIVKYRDTRRSLVRKRLNRS